ncbi:putative dna polymerase [Phaeomoniella chlamydospora]|uniref:Putative dna polymerase n=1 Tax=Phaeomoniella chlamydospora TaxID=158046 RepID=A0A0G2E871_PHACM|nr:putative dna polymerase [Phaeomoniella chlamydospora]
MIDYNVDLLNQNDLTNSFFCLDKQDPTVGFPYDASLFSGPTFPSREQIVQLSPSENTLRLRLVLGSHLATHLRYQLDEKHGYIATVGISTNKILSKLVGNVHKPKNQTTMLPPYESTTSTESVPLMFMDGHDIGKVPGIGFKLSQKIRALLLERPASFDRGLIYGGTLEKITVKDVRLYPGMGPRLLEDTLSGPGSQKGIGGIVWGLLHGIDDDDIAKAKKVPSQISIEDSYVRLDTIEEVKKELLMLSQSLIKRMQLDLTEEDDLAKQAMETKDEAPNGLLRRWLAHPKTLRLSTRPRPPLNPDGTRPRTFNRISRSCPMPNFVFNLRESIEARANRLLNEVLMSCFRKLHPEKSGWILSLLNIACTNMAETASNNRDSSGRDIGHMFQRQEDVLKEWKLLTSNTAVSDPQVTNTMPELQSNRDLDAATSQTASTSLAKDQVDSDCQQILDAEWDEDDVEDEESDLIVCPICNSYLPSFALGPHLTYHDEVAEKS